MAIYAIVNDFLSFSRLISSK